MKIAETNSQIVHVESLNSAAGTWALTMGKKVLTRAYDRYNLIDDCNRIRGHICADCTFGPACSFFPKAAA